MLGDGTKVDKPTPVNVSGLTSGAVKISLGENSSCAVTVAGAAKCWGRNAFGQLGDGTKVDKLVPTTVSGLGSGVVDIVTGGRFTFAILSTGTVKAWGTGLYGELGVLPKGDKLTPVDVPGLSAGVISIAAGPGHACAVMATGTAKCWGSNSQGQVGDGSTTDRATPTDVMDN
jgi:alpha-tubulin suppressor-like RCC1 family protein